MHRYAPFSDLEVRREGPVLVITMNRPEALNAMTAELHAALSEIFRVVASDEEAEVVVLTGAGRAFSAGGDLDWIVNQPREEYDTGFQEARRIILDLLELPQPTIAAVNGHAIGLGATLALFCDISYVAEDALVGDPHVQLGLVPGDGATIAWAQAAGIVRAKRHLLTGDPLTGSEAAAAGIVSEALPAADVLPEAMRMARRLTEMPRISVRGTKAALNAPLRELAAGLLETTLAIERRSRDSEEHHAALAAYAERVKGSR